MKDAFAIIYADQGDARLRELIEVRSVSALPVGGRYRAIDFVLSNVARSGIRSVGIIAQRNYKSLMDHLGSGKDWNLSRKQGGLMILPPYDLGNENGLYRGFGDALFAKRDFIDHQKQPLALLLGSGRIYRQDYGALAARHRESGADITLLYSRDPKLAADERHSFGLDIDKEGRVRAAGGANACECHSMGACLISKNLLVRLVEDACAEGRYDFGRDVLIPAVDQLKVVGVEHRGYMGQLDSVKAYFDVNMDIANSAEVRADLFDPAWAPYTKVMDAAPVHFSATSAVANSMFGNGSEIRGAVRDSVVFRGVTVEEGADVERCIVMQNSVLGRGCHLRNVIVDKDAVIGEGARIVGTPDNPQVVRKGAVVDGRTRGR